MNSVGLCYWNMHGYKSKCMGNKLHDSEFLNSLVGKDILGLGELHAEDTLSIPGFINKKQKIRDKNFSGPKIAGGDSPFCQGGNRSPCKGSREHE